MRSNIDYIAEYLKLQPTVSSLTLFNQFYGIADSKWIHDKWQRKELLPCRLNLWCFYKCEDIRIDRMGIKVVVNPVMEASHAL